MISLKQYLDCATGETKTDARKTAPPVPESIGPALFASYCSALDEMAAAGVKVCATPGGDLQQALAEVAQSLAGETESARLARADELVREALRIWAERTAGHFQARALEARELLLTLARTAHSVGERDSHCAAQMSRVTERLNDIACLEDLAEVRASVQESAAELKQSIDRMTAAGQSAMEALRTEISIYRARLEEAEYAASRDLLTGLGNRNLAEVWIKEQMHNHSRFCVVLMDIDGFKQVNDEHGHTTGDELLRQFASELRGACRTGDVVCRWGGDEFVVLMRCGQEEAAVQSGRLLDWVSGNYALQVRSAPLTLRIRASAGLAEYVQGENLKDLLDRADGAMYRNKAEARRAAASA
ncbi:MAG TPA: GGDEF domain-containing protein [Terracidiphilus sp.]|nr:GGDEF domain-containing protein [Terracidiphilus sp.]